MTPKKQISELFEKEFKIIIFRKLSENHGNTRNLGKQYMTKMKISIKEIEIIKKN